MIDKELQVGDIIAYDILYPKKVVTMYRQVSAILAPKIYILSWEWSEVSKSDSELAKKRIHNYHSSIYSLEDLHNYYVPSNIP